MTPKNSTEENEGNEGQRWCFETMGDESWRSRDFSPEKIFFLL
jgi:hypothetical protein